MTLHMETTKIAPEKTAQEIGAMLAKAGVVAVHTEYKDKKIVALSFSIDINGSVVPFRLPVRTEKLFDYFQARRDRYNRSDAAERDRAQAERVGWRQIYRWIQAQLALVDTGMVKAEEVFLPYVQTGIDETLFQRLDAGGFKQLSERLEAGGFKQLSAPEETH